MVVLVVVAGLVVVGPPLATDVVVLLVDVVLLPVVVVVGLIVVVVVLDVVVLVEVLLVEVLLVEVLLVEVLLVEVLLVEVLLVDDVVVVTVLQRFTNTPTSVTVSELGAVSNAKMVLKCFNTISPPNVEGAPPLTPFTMPLSFTDVAPSATVSVIASPEDSMRFSSIARAPAGSATMCVQSSKFRAVGQILCSSRNASAVLATV